MQLIFNNLKTLCLLGLFARGVLAAPVVTISTSNITVGQPATVEWTGGTAAAGSSGNANILLYKHTDLEYIMQAAISSWGTGGNFTWTPSASDNLNTTVTYAIGVQDSTGTGYTADFHVSAATATSPAASSTPTASPFASTSSGLSTAVKIVVIVVSILLPLLIVGCFVRCWRNRRQRQHDTNALAIELHQQGHGPEGIKEILRQRQIGFDVEKRSRRLDRKIARL